VPADVVVAALVWFEPNLVRAAWERSATVMPRRDAAEAFAACGHAYARERHPSSADDERLAALLGRVAANANPALAPVFAGFRSLPLPDDAKARAFHLLYAMRELRGGLHAAAVLTVGLTAPEAIAVRSPQVAALFGWDADLPDVGPLEERWSLAEARTDRMMGRHFAILDEAEQSEVVELVRSIDA
jgi:hypothetical protein